MDTAMPGTEASDPWETGKAFPHIGEAQNWQSLLPLVQVEVFTIDQCVQKLATAAPLGWVFTA